MSYGMIWVIIASTILYLVNPSQLELAVTSVGSATSQTQSVKLLTVKDDSDLPQIPYTIDTNEVRGGTKISSRFGSINVSTTTTVPTVDAITVYRLKDSQGNLLAYDLYLPENKVTVVFNAGNTIRALAFLDPRLIRWPNAERIELYQRFDQDSDFGAIEETLRNAKRIPTEFEPVLGRIKKLTRDTAERYARETGQLLKSE